MPASEAPAVPRIENTLLTEAQTAQRLQVSIRTLQGWRLSGGGPPFIKLGRRSVRYRMSDLDRWIEEQRRTSTSDPGCSESVGQQP